MDKITKAKKKFAEGLQREVKKQRIREAGPSRAFSAAGEHLKRLGSAAKTHGAGIVKNIGKGVMRTAAKHPKAAVGAAIGGAAVGGYAAHRLTQPKPKYQHPGY